MIYELFFCVFVLLYCRNYGRFFEIYRRKCDRDLRRVLIGGTAHVQGGLGAGSS